VTEEDELVRMLADNPLWLFLAPPGEKPKVWEAKVCADEVAEEDDVPSGDMMVAIAEMIADGRTVLLATRHKRHRLWAVEVASLVGWTIMEPRPKPLH
jgi:hypothetical protein